VAVVVVPLALALGSTAVVRVCEVAGLVAVGDGVRAAGASGLGGVFSPVASAGRGSQRSVP